MNRFSLIAVIFLFTLSCAEQQKAPPAPVIEAAPAAITSPVIDSVSKEEEKKEDNQFKLKYNLDYPDFTFKLPNGLLEISALTFNEQSKNLLAVNDERAIIYVLDGEDGTVKEQYDFGKRGDYEGIEIIGNTAYVVKSNGNVYSFDMKSKKAGEQYKTALSATNDVEGLGYDKKRNELILACKGSPNLNKQPKLKQSKAFYTFNLDNKKLSSAPKFVIEDKKLEAFFEKKMLAGVSKKSEKKLKSRLRSFSPSAIAKHPKDKQYYILSSVGKLMIVCNEKGEIIDIRFLSPKVFAQPEGICFASDGTMFISNEGRSLVSNVLKFKY